MLCATVSIFDETRVAWDTPAVRDTCFGESNETFGLPSLFRIVVMCFQVFKWRNVPDVQNSNLFI